MPKQPNRVEFSRQQCDELFAAVLAHDDIDLSAQMPDYVHLDYTQEQLEACYWICQQLWEEGVDRISMQRIATAIFRERSLAPDAQLAFKHMRAKFKHLRFAYVLFGRQHRYPPIFHRLVIVMGRLQDAFKNAHAGQTARFAIMLKIFLARIPYALVKWDISRFVPTTAEDFRSYVLREMSVLGRAVALREITSKEFHETRKIISRQVALYDNLRVVLPSPYHDQIARYLSTINGLMGKMHDDLIEKKLVKVNDYYADRFPMPSEIQLRLLTVSQRYDALLRE